MPSQVCGRIVSDVFTREAVTKALPHKKTETVKDPSDRNAPLTVVDRTIQTLKWDLASDVARHEGNWSEHLPDATLEDGRGAPKIHHVLAPGQCREAEQAAHRAQAGPDKCAAELREHGTGKDRAACCTPSVVDVEVDEVGLQPVVRPLGRVFAQRSAWPSRLAKPGPPSHTWIVAVGYKCLQDLEDICYVG